MLRPDPPMTCTNCEEWNTPRAPFKVFGNTYFVGSQGLSSLLIVTDAGLVLIDVALPQSAPLIDANIRTLGFRTTDVKYILSSHAHFDHVGGMRSMQRFTRATVLASRETARALGLGHPVPEDPQFEADASQNFPGFTDGVRAVKDGEVTRLGATAITAHYTPGHTPGATTWTWQSCEGAALPEHGLRRQPHRRRQRHLPLHRRPRPAKHRRGLPCQPPQGGGAAVRCGDLHPSIRDRHGRQAGPPHQRRPDARRAWGSVLEAGACKALAAVSTEGLNARVAAESKR